MSENDKKTSETETILMALDQISQTIDVMTSVVGRLRTYVQHQETSTSADRTSNSSTQRQTNQTLH